MSARPPLANGGDPEPSVGVVVATRNRRERLLQTLEQLEALPERPPIVVVDNASEDGTVEMVSEGFPAVKTLALDRNRGAFARNLGAEELDTPLVAFSDDDSWWEPGALARAAHAFQRFPRTGLIAVRILVGPERRIDPTSAAMRGPTPPRLPGPRVSGFVACGAIVRRRAFLEAGGFSRRFLIGGEEDLVAIDMSAAGWDLCYMDAVVAVHMPDGSDRGDRSWLRLRNRLWTSLMRRSPRAVLDDTVHLLAHAGRDPAARRALAEALPGLPWAAWERFRFALDPRGSRR